MKKIIQENKNHIEYNYPLTFWSCKLKPFSFITFPRGIRKRKGARKSAKIEDTEQEEKKKPKTKRKGPATGSFLAGRDGTLGFP
jgi:hypothetical protein